MFWLYTLIPSHWWAHNGSSAAIFALFKNVTTFYNFSSVQFYLAKVNYNAKIHIRIVSWQGSPEETRRPKKPGLRSHKEISKMVNQSQLERERIENLALTIRCQVDALWHNLCLQVLSFQKLQIIKIRWISYSVLCIKLVIIKTIKTTCFWLLQWNLPGYYGWGKSKAKTKSNR